MVGFTHIPEDEEDIEEKQINKKEENQRSYDMLFTPIESKGLDTNEGAMLQIMATVVDIAKDFIERYKPEEVTIHPITRTSTDDPKRSRIYGYYLRKNIPENYRLIQIGESYTVKRK